MSERPRVLIVGAGPTGLTMAHELAGDGISCRVIDKAPHRAMESRAIAIHARTVETFELMGLADDFLEAGHRIAGVSIYGESGRIVAEGGPGAQLIDREGGVASRYGSTPAAYLIRPDGYVGFRCRAGQLFDHLPRYLANLFGPPKGG